MYDLGDYGSMLSDEARIRAYERALRQVVKPGDVVLEIGTGTGIMAILACQLGAKRVYAIEPSPVIQLARGIAADNHCVDRIEFIEEVSRRVASPILADVIVSDLRGALPLLQDHILTIADARRRFLAPGGRMIGQKDRLWVAVVEDPKAYEKIVGPWEHSLLGQELRLGRQMVVNETHRLCPASAQFLACPQLWAELDYKYIEDPDVEGTLKWKIERNGTGHGIVVWFEALLAEGVCFSTAPDIPKTVYSPLFLLWEKPVTLVAGQTVCVTLQAKFVRENYFWRWVTRIESVGRTGEIEVQFDQSQLKGGMLSPAKLRKTASNYIPQLSEEGVIRARVFELMDGKNSLEEIASRLTVEFPGRFAQWRDALPLVASVSRENCR